MIPNDLLQGWRILVVDDEPDSLEVARYILDFYGAEVYTATQGVEGFEVAVQLQPKFIISDLSMPLMDGWGLLHALSADERTAHIPIVALTAHAMRGDRERAINAGFHNYLTKPLTADTFIQELLELLMSIPVLAEELNI